MVREGIDSISLNPDTYARGRILVWRTEVIETALREEAKNRAYDFLLICDETVDKLRVPRGKLRNYIRKKRKRIDPEITLSSERLNDIFKQIANLAVRYVNDIEFKKYRIFNEFEKKFKSELEKITSELPGILEVVKKI